MCNPLDKMIDTLDFIEIKNVLYEKQPIKTRKRQATGWKKYL